MRNIVSDGFLFSSVVRTLSEVRKYVKFSPVKLIGGTVVPAIVFSCPVMGVVCIGVDENSVVLIGNMDVTGAVIFVVLLTVVDVKVVGTRKVDDSFSETVLSHITVPLHSPDDWHSMVSFPVRLYPPSQE